MTFKPWVLNNVTATADNYTVNVAASAGGAKVTVNDSNLTGLNVVNNAGENAEINLNNTKLTCNDLYDDQIFFALCVNKDAIGGSIIANGCTFDIKGDSCKATVSAEAGTITIDGSSDEVIISAVYIDYGSYYAPYVTLQEAIDSAKSGDKIVLIRDITLEKGTTIVIPEGKTLTIDLNGKTLNGTSIKQVPTLINKGTLTVSNGEIASTGACGGSALDNRGTVVVDEVTFEGATCTGIDGWWASYAIKNTGNMTINNSEVNSYHGAIASYNGGAVTINGITIDVGQDTRTDITSWALYAYDNGSIVVNNGDIVMTKQEVSVNGGGCICTNDTGTIIFNSGKVIKEGSHNSGGPIYVKPNTLTINGGIFDADPSAYVAKNHTVTNNGDGTWTVTPPAEVNSADALNNAIDQGADYIILSGDIAVSETVVIPAGAEITLDLNGKTITGNMHKDVGAVIKNVGTLTVLNGTITSSANNGGSAILNNGTLTVKDAVLNGAPNADGSWPSYAMNNSGVAALYNTKLTSYHGAVSSYGQDAKVTLNDCEIDMKGILGFTNHGIYVYDSGMVEVNGGTYINHAADQGSSGGSVINGHVVVNSGTFGGRIESYDGTPVLNGGTFSVEPRANFVAEGKTVVNNGDGTWTVQ